jgi:hypothetical protein
MLGEMLSAGIGDDSGAVVNFAHLVAVFLHGRIMPAFTMEIGAHARTSPASANLHKD